MWFSHGDLEKDGLKKLIMYSINLFPISTKPWRRFENAHGLSAELDVTMKDIKGNADKKCSCSSEANSRAEQGNYFGRRLFIHFINFDLMTLSKVRHETNWTGWGNQRRIDTTIRK